MRDLFEQAKQNSPCIIFMDEIDAVGRHRGAGMGGGHDEREQTLNQLLVEMDGFEMKDNIILIAATNRPDILDPALLRPGRFDRQIVVDRPDRKGRAKILEVHTRGKPLAKEIDLDDARRPDARASPAPTSRNLVNEAALLAARNGKREITQDELEEGIMRVIAGPEKKTRVMSEKERLITAYHEMGHAIVGHYLEHSDPVHKISIISRGQALGYTISMPQEDKFLTTRAELHDTMAMTLGGRAAEEIVFGEITTGASNDLEKVTATAKAMVMRFGMSEKLGPRVFGHDHGQPFLGREFSSEPDYSDEIAREIDDEIRRIVEAAHQRAERHPHGAPRGADDDLGDPAQARDDRERRVHRPARRQVRGGRLRPRRAADAAEPGRADAGRPRPARPRARSRAPASPAAASRPAASSCRRSPTLACRRTARDVRSAASVAFASTRATSGRRVFPASVRDQRVRSLSVVLGGLVARPRVVSPEVRDRRPASRRPLSSRRVVRRPCEHRASAHGCRARPPRIGAVTMRAGAARRRRARVTTGDERQHGKRRCGGAPPSPRRSRGLRLRRRPQATASPAAGQARAGREDRRAAATDDADVAMRHDAVSGGAARRIRSPPAGIACAHGPRARGQGRARHRSDPRHRPGDRHEAGRGRLRRRDLRTRRRRASARTVAALEAQGARAFGAAVDVTDDAALEGFVDAAAQTLGGAGPRRGQRRRQRRRATSSRTRPATTGAGRWSSTSSTRRCSSARPSRT